MKTNRTTQNTLGFTLVELLSVLVIVAILAALLVPMIFSGLERGNRAEDTSKMREMAQAVLLFHSAEGRLPGRLNRAVRVPSHIAPNERDRWFSTYMADKGYLPEQDSFWGPVVDYGIAEGGHGYILNNTIHSSPGNFFGRRSNNPALISEALRIIELRSNLADELPEVEELSRIWMITNLDGGNYNATATAGSDFSVGGQVKTPWGGRHYAFFDGSVSFIEEGNYPSRD